MLEYLEKPFRKRMCSVADEHANNPDVRLKWCAINESEKQILRALPEDIVEAIIDLDGKKNDLDAAEACVIYRAGWLDGIAIGVMAATRGRS